MKRSSSGLVTAMSIGCLLQSRFYALFRQQLERRRRCLDGLLDRLLIVRQADEPRLELAGRKVDAALQHRVEELGEAARVAGGGLDVVADRLPGRRREEH